MNDRSLAVTHSGVALDTDTAVDAHVSVEPPITRMLASGALACLGYGLLHVAINGVAFDDLITPAQIITGHVRYPAGHPQEVAWVRLFSLLDYVAAGLWWLFPSTAFVSGFFNVLWLFFSGFTPFALVAVLTRRSAWASLGAAFGIVGAALCLQGTYPMWSFPTYYSNGHVGTLAAVLTVGVVIGRMWRTGGLLLGLLPAVHASMAAIVWPWTVFYLVLGKLRPNGTETRRFALWFTAGLGVCLALAATILLRAAALSTAPPYDMSGGGDAIYRAFTAVTDVHRRTFSPLEPGYGVNVVGYFIIVALLIALTRVKPATEATARVLGRMHGLLAFGLLLWVVVYGVWLARVLGLPIPTTIEMLMPFRYSNLSALILVPLTVTLLWLLCERSGQSYDLHVTGLVLLGLLGASALMVVDRWLVNRNLLFGLWALAFAIVIGRGRVAHPSTAQVARLAALISGVGFIAIGALILAGFPSPLTAAFYTTVFVTTLAALWLAARLESTSPLTAVRARLLSDDGARVRLQAIAIVIAAALFAAGALQQRREESSWLRASAFDVQLRAWLDRTAPRDEPILHATGYDDLQPRLERPELFHWNTMYLMSYMPELAPVIGMLVTDLYGIDYSLPETRTACDGRGPHRQCALWLEAWRRRTPEEWAALRTKYGFRHVLTPNDVRLSLPVVLRGEEWSLHEVR